MDTDNRFSRLKEITGRALDLRGDERAKYLDAACRGDASLREEVELLLQADANPHPALRSGPLHEVIEHVLPTETLIPGDAVSGNFGVPERFGNFRLVRLIDQGGMGSVFEAEQENPRRTVALKIIRPGLTSQEHLRRFEHEAQLLGRLQHPGIARIYEAGTADVGQGTQPYFAMELISWGTVVQHATEMRLDARARLELLAKICDAVHYAHQKGVIHRDLKPGNILVDSFGQPKIVDFGVARVTDSDVQTSTMHTHAGQLLGTVHYMSPEQLAADPDALDVQSDVYALGVIAYELLSGQLPYDLREKSLHEVARIISEEDPRPLSTVDRTFRGDLETIIGKALEKETSRRYESAAALAADIRRYLKDEPIQARPASTLYQLRKFAKRNRALVGGLVATFVVLAVGAAVSTVQYFRAERSRREAVIARDDAVQEAAKAQAVTSFLQDMLSSASPDSARGREVTVREILQASTAKIDTAFSDQPLVEATVRMTIGWTYRQMGNFPEAESHLRKALAIRQRELGAEHVAVGESQIALAELLTNKGQRAEAESLLRVAVAVSERIFGEENEMTIQALHTLGYVMWGQEQYDEAERLHRRVLELRRRTLGDEDANTLFTRMYIGMARRDVGQIDDAEAIFRDGLEASRKSLGNDHRVTLHFMNQLGEVLAKQNKFDEAEQLLGEALETRRRVYGSHHKLVGETLLALSDLRFRQGRVAEAEVLAREVVLQQEKNPDRTKGWARRTLLQALLKQDKYVEAHPYWLQEREALRVAADDSLATAEQKEAYARFLLTSDPERWQDPETALAYAQRAAASADGKTARIHFTLARAYSVSGDVLHADSVLEQALLLVSPSESAMREEIEILQRNIDATGGPQR